MKKSQELHDLVRSLSRSEKRFFKIYCSRHEIGGKNNYVQLFELLDGIQEYNEKKVERKIAAQTFIKHKAAEQNYLYQMILECLDIYHKESSVDKQITKLTNIARVLANKKLEEQSVKILEKARQLAESHNRFASLIPIFELQKRKHFSQDTIDQEKLETHYRNLDSVLHRLNQSRNYQKIFDELMLLRRKVGQVANPQVLTIVEKIFPNAETLELETFSSFDEEVFYLLAKMEYFRLVRKSEAGNNVTTRLIALFENNAKQVTGVYIDHYIYALNVFIVNHLYKDEQEARAALEKLNHLENLIGKRANNTYVKAKVFEIYYTCITDLAIKSKTYTEITSQIKEIEQRFVEVEKHMTPTFSMVLKSNIACVFFGAGQYKEALKWCHIVVNDAPNLREDIYYIMRILYLLLHFELENAVIMPSLIQSTTRYFGKQKRVFKFETLFIKFLKQLLKTDSKRDQKALFLKFKEEITPLKDHTYENLAMSDIDIFGWIDKKIGGK